MSKKILWIEDDLMIGTILGNKLVNVGYDLIHINTGEEAMYYFKDSVPDLVVLDLFLPGIDGFAILKHMRGNDVLKNVPVIILSNVNREADIAIAKSFGVKVFLVKTGNTLEEIVAKVKEFCPL
jgi:DNA-binding response OmpR family regulator